MKGICVNERYKTLTFYIDKVGVLSGGDAWTARSSQGLLGVESVNAKKIILSTGVWIWGLLFETQASSSGGVLRDDSKKNITEFFFMESVGFRDSLGDTFVDRIGG